MKIRFNKPNLNLFLFIWMTKLGCAQAFFVSTFLRGRLKRFLWVLLTKLYRLSVMRNMCWQQTKIFFIIVTKVGIYLRSKCSRKLIVWRSVRYMAMWRTRSRQRIGLCLISYIFHPYHISSYWYAWRISEMYSRKTHTQWHWRLYKWELNQMEEICWEYCTKIVFK